MCQQEYMLSRSVSLYVHKGAIFHLPISYTLTICSALFLCSSVSLFFFAISTSPSFIFNSSTIGLRLTCSSFFLNLRIILHSSHNFSHTALLLSSELFSFNPLLLFWLAAKPRSFLLFTPFLSHYRLDSSYISPYCLLHQLIYPNQPNPTKRSTKNCEK